MRQKGNKWHEGKYCLSDESRDQVFNPSMQPKVSDINPTGMTPNIELASPCSSESEMPKPQGVLCAAHSPRGKMANKMPTPPRARQSTEYSELRPARACLSPEHDEMRRILKQDMHDAFCQFARTEIQTLRQDMRELLSRTKILSASSFPRSAVQRKELPEPERSDGVGTADVMADTTGLAFGGPRMGLPSMGTEIALTQAMEAHNDEVFGLRATVSRLAALLERTSNGARADAKLAQDIEAALSALGKKAEDTGAGDRATRRGIPAMTEGAAKREKSLSFEVQEAPSDKEERKGRDTGMRRPSDEEADAALEEDLLVAAEHTRSGGPNDAGVGSEELQGLSNDNDEGIQSKRTETPAPSLGEHTSATNISGPTVVDDEEAYKWEWERSGGKGWAAYTKSQAKRIERAWRNGSSRVRLRSGQEGKTPMEIFLVDMLQLDPVSMTQRMVRRIGRVPWWRTPQRRFRALMREIQTGEPRWESFEQYKFRQELIFGPNLDMLKARILRGQSQELQKIRHRSTCRKRWQLIANSDLFHVSSITITILQAVWIGVDVDKNFGLSLYQKPPPDQFVEYFFCIFFAFELFARLMTYVPRKLCWKSPWFCFDSLLVLFSVVEVLIIPPIREVVISRDVDNWEGLAVFRVMRLAKVIRIMRIFGASSDAVPFFKGLLSGMRSAAFIWGLLLALLFMFSVLLRLNAHAVLVETYFPNVAMSMLTLVAYGVMLDEVTSIIDAILQTEDLFTFVCFAMFVFLAHFNLLNMLVGAFCSVAGEVSASEKDAAQIEYLRENLACIVDCYIHDEGLIGRKEFELIIKNADVHRTLAQCGTDMEELAGLETLLFHRRTEIDFDSLFKAIVHLRKGKTATVKDIMHVQGVLGRQLEVVRRKLDINEQDEPPHMGECVSVPSHTGKSASAASASAAAAADAAH